MLYPEFTQQISFYCDPENFDKKRLSQEEIMAKRQAIMDAKKRGEERARKRKLEEQNG